MLQQHYIYQVIRRWFTNEKGSLINIVTTIRTPPLELLVSMYIVYGINVYSVAVMFVGGDPMWDRHKHVHAHRRSK